MRARPPWRTVHLPEPSLLRVGQPAREDPAGGGAAPGGAAAAHPCDHGPHRGCRRAARAAADWPPRHALRRARGARVVSVSTAISADTVRAARTGCVSRARTQRFNALQGDCRSPVTLSRLLVQMHVLLFSVLSRHAVPAVHACGCVAGFIWLHCTWPQYQASCWPT